MMKVEKLKVSGYALQFRGIILIDASSELMSSNLI
jgi:hypothetical protein